jgi:hypothetical protein
MMMAMMAGMSSGWRSRSRRLGNRQGGGAKGE